MNPPLIGGAIQSRPDYRDGIAAVSAPTVPPTTLPASYQTDFSLFGIYNQAQEPACVSHTWAEKMKEWWYREHGEIVDFSPRFLDILSAEPDIPLDGGRPPAHCRENLNHHWLRHNRDRPERHDLADRAVSQSERHHSRCKS
jgi:hypothetical protein